VSISAANFLATLALLHWLPSDEFGQFSFALVVSGLCASLTNGLLGTPLASIARVPPADAQEELNTYFKTNLVAALLIAILVFGVTLPIGMPVGTAAMFGLYSAAMSLRLVARTYAYTANRVHRVVLSDCVYSLSMISGVCLVVFVGGARLPEMALMMALGAIFSLIPFGRRYFSVLNRALASGSLRGYRRIWRDLTRWTVLGVVTSEMTMNAHAYLVTFIRGPQAFALIAVGALFMRPFALVLTALPDREAPAMARTIAAGNIARALKHAKEYLAVVAALWFANQVLAGSVLIWFPSLVIKPAYGASSVISVVAIWALISAVRGARAPEIMLLYAAREFRALANASVVSSVVALTLTAVLLLVAGPIVSLFGIFGGDVAMWLAVKAGVRTWRKGCPVAPLLPAPGLTC